MRKLIVALAIVVAACSPAASTETVVEVPGDFPSLSAAIERVPDGATIRLAPGRYEEQVMIGRPITLIGDDAELVGSAGGTVISVNGATGVTIQGLTIIGGATGIAVTDSSEVTIVDNLITGSTYRGVEVVYGAATVTGNRIFPAPGPYAIGIKVANASSWPESVISGNVIEYAGGYGIAVNFANVTVDGNDVTGGASAGIAVNEMSHADVLGNTVRDAPRYGILVHDMSHAVLTNNRIAGADEPIKLTYHSTVKLDGNQTD